MNNDKKFDYTVLAIFFPAVAALALIPILMHATFVTTDFLETYRLFSGTPGEDGLYYFADVFSQCKAFAVVVFAIIMLAVTLFSCFYLFRRVEKRSLVYVGASVVFVGMALASALTSDYTHIAFYGDFDRAEGFITTACYFVIFLFTMFAFRSEQNFRPLMAALFICVGVNAVLGAFEYSGHALVNYDWFSTLIVDRKYADQIQPGSAAAVRGSLFGALYHYNYVGSFAGMIVPLFTSLALFEKQLKWRILYIVFDLAALFLLFGSAARSGIVALAAALVMGIIVFARVIAKHWKAALAVLAAGAAAVTGINFAVGGELFRRVPSIVSDMVELFIPADEADADLFSKLPVRDIVHNADGSLSFVTNSDTLTISYDAANEEYLFTDSAGDPVEMIYDENAVTSDDGRFAGISMLFGEYTEGSGVDDMFLMWFTGDEKSFLTFRLFGENTIHQTDPNIGDRITAHNAEAIGFKGKELLGSSRGYIWSRTIPLLDECIITGYGADTFPYVFPQTDFLAKHYAYTEGFNITVDKPHNLYLQIFFSNGLIALLAFLFICVWYLVDCLRLYAFRREYRPAQVYGAAVMLAVTGYLAAGLFNDSVVSVAPVFWILLGTGCALNMINRRADRGGDPDGEENAPRRATADEKRIEAQAEEMAQQVVARLHANDSTAPAAETQEKRQAEKERSISGEDMQALMQRVKKIADAPRDSAENSDRKE